jgi:hypothetical protein
MGQNILIVSHPMDGTNMNFAVDFAIVSCSTCISGDVVCGPCKDFARERYKLRFPHSSLVGSFFVFPDRGEEEKHVESFGTYSLQAKVFGICSQLGYICEIAANPINCFHDRTDDDIVEYELTFTEEERAQSDMEIVASAAKTRSLIGRWPLDHYAIQRWLFHATNDPVHPEYQLIAHTITCLYHEDIFEILEEGPMVRNDSTLACLRSVVDLFYSSDLC